MITVAVLGLIDVLGYSFRVKRDSEFSSYHLREVPFIWFFYSSKPLNQKDGN